MTCHYCAFNEGKHDKNCPKPGSPEMDIWKIGYDAGRNGRPAADKNPIYILGWRRGDSRLDAKQNAW